MSSPQQRSEIVSNGWVKPVTGGLDATVIVQSPEFSLLIHGTILDATKTWEIRSLSLTNRDLSDMALGLNLFSELLDPIDGSYLVQLLETIGLTTPQSLSPTDGTRTSLSLNAATFYTPRM
jgi:hypothetical protein